MLDTMTTEYQAFLDNKRFYVRDFGDMVETGTIHLSLFPFQKDLTKWAIRKGRAAIFADTGLGKTVMQCEWARLSADDSLIVAPLSVARQTVREGRRIGLDIHYVRSAEDVVSGISITNYEMIEAFDPMQFGAIVLDESSILKSLSSKTRLKLTSMFASTPRKLCCTATPAPNDIAEIANHAEFLGIMTRADMLATFFVHDDEGWRLKGHAIEPFFKWMASWSMSIRYPSDLGYDDDGYILPPLNITPEWVRVDYRPDGQLFMTDLGGIQGRLKVRRETIDAKAERIAELVNASDEQWVIWCGLNEEADSVRRLVIDSRNVQGSDSLEKKAKDLEDFQDGVYRVLITKPRVAGFGMNLQNAHNMAFVGLSDSFEAWYQCIRREYRFGQNMPVNVHIALAEQEDEVYNNVLRKESEARAMTDQLIRQVQHWEVAEIMDAPMGWEYSEDVKNGDDWTMLLGDSAERLRELPAESIDLSVYSPPFMSLYTYSPTERDLGNNRDAAAFFEHFGYIIDELLRVTKPGRVTAVHVADVPAMLVRDSYIGLKDFPGETIREFERRGWIFDGRVTIDKNPQVQALRTKAKGLVFRQLETDSTWSRPAIADQILKFRKPGENAVPVHPDISREEWILWARAVWYAADYTPGTYAYTGGISKQGHGDESLGIRETDTLQFTTVRSEEDERHICMARGSLVLTRQYGYIPIEAVNVGDLVLTHLGRWMPVTAKRCNGIKAIVRTSGQGVADLRTTPDHLIWTRQALGDHARQYAQAADPSWMRAESTLGSYLNLKLPPIENNPLTAKEWWIVGRWLGDGHRGGHHHSGKRGGLGQFIISCAHDEVPALLAILGEHAGHVAVVTATQIAIVGLRPEVRDVLNRCGHGAAGKRLPGEAVALDPDKAMALLDGYLSADGCYVEMHDRHCASSVSRALLLGMAMVAQRARNVVASVYAGRPERDGVIQGRAVHMSQDWVFSFRGSQGYRHSGWIAHDGAWRKVRKVEPSGNAEVWDIQVEEDASFTAEGAIVHNCPLQLGTIERCVRLWSNPGETVLSPFAGIGSEGVVSLKHGRKFIGIELKPEYWRQACRNLETAVTESNTPTLFDMIEEGQ